MMVTITVCSMSNTNMMTMTRVAMTTMTRLATTAMTRLVTTAMTRLATTAMTRLATTAMTNMITTTMHRPSWLPRDSGCSRRYCRKQVRWPSSASMSVPNSPVASAPFSRKMKATRSAEAAGPIVPSLPWGMVSRIVR